MGHVRGGGHGPGISIPRAHELPKAQSLSLIFPLITLITSFHFSFHHFLVETNVVRVDIFTIMTIEDIILMLSCFMPQMTDRVLIALLLLNIINVHIVIVNIITIMIIIIIIIIIILMLLLDGLDDKWGLDCPRAIEHPRVPSQSSYHFNLFISIFNST